MNYTQVICIIWSFVLLAKTRQGKIANNKENTAGSEPVIQNSRDLKAWRARAQGMWAMLHKE